MSRVHLGQSCTELSSALVKLFEVTTTLKSVNFFETEIDQYFTNEVLHALSQNRFAYYLTTIYSLLGAFVNWI